MGVESSFNILSWLIFGALAGWLASKLAGEDDRQGCLTNIVVGIVGAFIGGFLFAEIRGRDVFLSWNLESFIVAVVGAVVLLVILRLIRR